MMEILNALLGPFAETNTWYGVFVAFSFTKAMKKIVRGGLTRLDNKISGDDDDAQR